MKKRTVLYVGLLILAIVLFIISVTVLGNTTFIAPITIVVSIYLFVGSLTKLCKMNDKLKNHVICAIDLLFWLP